MTESPDCYIIHDSFVTSIITTTIRIRFRCNHGQAFSALTVFLNDWIAMPALARTSR